MNRHGNVQYIVLLGFILSLAGILLAQSTPKTLVVNGKVSSAAIRQIDGRSYIDVEDLPEITNGVVTIEANRILLTIPEATSSSSSSPSPSAPPEPVVPGLSRGFAGAAIAALAEMREWRGAIGTMITYGLAVSAGWSQDYNDRVEASLMQATVAVSTDSDAEAVQLLNNEYNALAGWANDVVTARQALNGAKTVDPNALQNDPALAKITDCGRFLNTMLVSGVFADDASCH